ncbi:MAG: hypothetical protein KatS3mg011_0475 [Acidimicrobiia bacterium]|nr:MAG: hypothetical protein KatS3mg011_0475 [Acidimicrobiia bacterium]
MSVRLLAVAAVLAALASACSPAAQSDPVSEAGHTHDDVHDLPASEAPTLEVEVSPDPVSGVNLHLVTERFTWAPESASGPHVPGEGHAHVYVDGRKVARVYTPWFHLDGLQLGSHELRVDLTANDHAVYAADGEPVADTVLVEVPEPGEGHGDHSHGGDAAHDGTGMEVSLMVVEDPVGGWNVFVDTAGFVFAPERASGAHVPGEGHGHLYVDGQKVARLYGAAYHLESLEPGSREIRVALYGNDHLPYVVDGTPVDAIATVEVEGTPTQIDQTIELRADVETPERVEIALGTVVELIVAGDVSDQVHLHGYEVLVPISPEEPARLVFTADVPGVFELELERSGTLLAQVVVSD